MTWGSPPPDPRVAALACATAYAPTSSSPSSSDLACRNEAPLLRCNNHDCSSALLSLRSSPTLSCTAERDCHGGGTLEAESLGTTEDTVSIRWTHTLFCTRRQETFSFWRWGSPSPDPIVETNRHSIISPYFPLQPCLAPPKEGTRVR